MADTRVLYWEIDKGRKPVKKTDICWARVAQGNYDYDKHEWGPAKLPDIIRYSAPIKGGLTKAEVMRYVAFLQETLDPTVFKAKMAARTPKRILWELDTAGMTRTQAMVYLTAFRYVDEYAALVKDWVKTEADTAAKSFDAFMVCHGAYSKTGGRQCLSGHGLTISSDVSLKVFRANLKDASLKTVSGHFEKPVAKAGAAPAV